MNTNSATVTRSPNNKISSSNVTMQIPPFRREKTPSEIRKETAYRSWSALPERIVSYFDEKCNINNRLNSYLLFYC